MLRIQFHESEEHILYDLPEITLKRHVINKYSDHIKSK